MDAILADVERLGLEYARPITYTSGYFPQMLDLAERLIKKGSLYADDTPVEQMRAVRALGPLLTPSQAHAAAPELLQALTAANAPVTQAGVAAAPVRPLLEAGDHTLQYCAVVANVQAGASSSNGRVLRGALHGLLCRSAWMA